jgi:hypothetical protein
MVLKKRKPHRRSTLEAKVLSQELLILAKSHSRTTVRRKEIFVEN